MRGHKAGQGRVRKLSKGNNIFSLTHEMHDGWMGDRR